MSTHVAGSGAVVALAPTLYGGPFLSDFHVEQSDSFDDWVTRARDR